MNDKLDPMTAVYVLIAHFCIYTALGFTCSFISEYYHRKKRAASSSRALPKYCMSWQESIGYWREYYHSFAFHAIDEGTSIAAIISMYCLCQDRYGTDMSDWKLLTSQAKPSMLLLLSFIIWASYKLCSAIYLILIDIFSWFQVFLHLLDCNYLYEMFIAHSQKNKNPIIQWMHRQYVYFCSIPLWFLQFVFLLRWNHILSTSSPVFVCILLSVLFGLINIFYVILWCDIRSFSSECKEWFQRGFRLRFAFRGCQFISRMVWLSFLWIFLGSGPFFIVSLILLLNHFYLYFRGYLGEIYYVMTKFFIIPDISIGVGYRNSSTYKKVDWFTKIMYMVTHCAGCVIGIWVIVEEDLLYIDMLFWLHWFEDLLLWAIITGICDQQKTQIFGATYYNLWDKIWTDPTYTAFYSLGIITWFFSGAYFMVLRIEDFIDKTKQPLSISQGILGLAENGEWDSLDKFLPRMKKISINRKNLLDNNRTAIHYAIQQNKWNIVKKLIEHGANVNIMDRNHQSGVHLMCLNRELSDMSIFKMFLNAFDGDPVTKRDNSGKTILHLICQNGADTLPLENRLKFYFDAFGGDNKQNASDIDVNIADNDGCTALHYIVEQTNDIQALEIVINNGALIDIEDNNKRTALIHAVSKNQNNPTTVRYLLSNGANMNHQDDKGWTPLHFAASSNLTDNVFILLEYFPNITIRNNAGKNAYNLADSMGYTTIADTLKMNMPFEELIEMDPSDMVQHAHKTNTDTIAITMGVSDNNNEVILDMDMDASKQEEKEEEEAEEEDLLPPKEENKAIKEEENEDMDIDIDAGIPSPVEKGDGNEKETLLIGTDNDNQQNINGENEDIDTNTTEKSVGNEVENVDEAIVGRVSKHIELTDVLDQDNNEYHD